MLGSTWLSYKRIFMKSYQKFVTPTKLPLAFSRLRDSGESEKSFKNKKTRGGWGETIAPFAKSRASYFRFARFTSALYYLRAWHRLNFPLFCSSSLLQENTTPHRTIDRDSMETRSSKVKIKKKNKSNSVILTAKNYVYYISTRGYRTFFCFSVRGSVS